MESNKLVFYVRTGQTRGPPPVTPACHRLSSPFCSFLPLSGDETCDLQIPLNKCMAKGIGHCSCFHKILCLCISLCLSLSLYLSSSSLTVSLPLCLSLSLFLISLFPSLNPNSISSLSLYFSLALSNSLCLCLPLLIDIIRANSLAYWSWRNEQLSCGLPPRETPERKGMASRLWEPQSYNHRTKFFQQPHHCLERTLSPSQHLGWSLETLWEKDPANPFLRIQTHWNSELVNACCI